MKLELSPDKTVVTSFAEGFDFLGFHFSKGHVGVGCKSLKGFYTQTREKTRRNQGGIPLDLVIRNTNDVVRGWGNYHQRGDNAGLFKTLDKWVRNRVRAYVRQRWRDRGRWKVLSAEQLDEKGLLRLERVSKRCERPQLFSSLPQRG